MELNSIAFPVYKLGQHKPFEVDGVVFFINKYTREGDEVTTIVDDKGQYGETLAKRRLTLLSKKVKLFKLRTAIFFPSDLIKLAKGSHYWFIDSRGRAFQYKKSKYVKLSFHRIQNILPIPTGGSILVLKDKEQRFKTLYKVDPKLKYAGLLELDSKSFLLYGVYETLPKDSTRKI